MEKMIFKEGAMRGQGNCVNLKTGIENDYTTSFFGAVVTESSGECTSGRMEKGAKSICGSNERVARFILHTYEMVKE